VDCGFESAGGRFAQWQAMKSMKSKTATGEVTHHDGLNSEGIQSAIRNPRSAIFYWAPPVLWLAAIYFFSTDNFSGENTGGIFFRIFHFLIPGLTEEAFAPYHFLIRKCAHFTEYGVLALLLYRAFRRSAPLRWNFRWAMQSLLIVIGYSLLDEYHQTFTANRVGSISDSMIDSAGGFTSLAALRLLFKRRDRHNNLI
jgi:VanZ family protein